MDQRRPTQLATYPGFGAVVEHSPTGAVTITPFATIAALLSFHLGADQWVTTGECLILPAQLCCTLDQPVTDLHVRLQIADITAPAWTDFLYTGALPTPIVISDRITRGPGRTYISLDHQQLNSQLLTAGWGGYFLLSLTSGDMAVPWTVGDFFLLNDTMARYQERLPAAYCGRCGFITPRAELVRDGWSMALVCRRCWSPPEAPEPSTAPDDEWKEPA